MLSQKDIEFLKEVTMASKTVVVQINKEKFKAMREKIESSMWLILLLSYNLFSIYEKIQPQISGSSLW